MSAVRERRRAAPAPGSGSTAALYGKLHPGPGAPREQVEAHQRARICGAVIEIVARGGYRALTVREIVGLAGVSTHTFYEHFVDKDVCFRETYALIARRSAKRVISAQARGDSWELGLRAGFHAFAEQLASERKAARLALVEAFGGGERARERMEGAFNLYEGMLASAFAHAPDGVEVPPLLVKGIVSGIARVARTRVMDGRAEELPAAVDELVRWTLALRQPEAACLTALKAACRQLDHDEPPITRRAAPGERDDRQRLIDAALALATRDGYAALTAPKVRARAGVSRKRFLEHFEDVEDCFSVGVAQLTQRAMKLATGAGATAPDWPRGVHRTIRELCALMLADPVYAKLAFVESLAPGPGAVRCRDSTTSSVARALRRTAPEAQRPSELAAEASVGAIWGLMHRYVEAGRARGLQQAAPLLSFLALAPAIGARGALEAIAAEPRRPEGAGS
jgi:AcrR family transcriptional regulator